MSDTATLSSKFQISIPKGVREQQGWKPGQKFVFLPQGKGYVLVPVPSREDLFGIARDVTDVGEYRDRRDRY